MWCDAQSEGCMLGFYLHLYVIVFFANKFPIVINALPKTYRKDKEKTVYIMGVNLVHVS